MGKAATVITATLVAVFFSGLANAGRVYVPQKSGSASTVASAIASRVGDIVSAGAMEGTYIPGYQQDRQIPVKVLNSNDFSARRTFEAATGLLKRGGPVAAAVAASAAVGWAADQVGGFIDDQKGGLYKKGQPAGAVTTNPDNGEYYWTAYSPTIRKSSPELACNAALAQQAKDYSSSYKGYVYDSVQMQNPSQAICYGSMITSWGGYAGTQINMSRSGSSCPAGSTFDGAHGYCAPDAVDSVPFTDADYDQLQAAMNSASGSNTAGDPNFIKDLIRASCEGSTAPQRCYESLMANGPGQGSQSLSGPSSVTAPGTSSITVSKDKDGNATSTTTTSNTTFNITYGNNYYSYSSTTTKTKTNPDGSTETTTEEEPDDSAEKYPEQPDPLSPVIKEYDKVTEAVKTPQETVAGLDSKAWFSFGGSCQELDLDTPIGHIKTNYCPTVESYVKPVLGFIFAVCAYLYCAAIWRETTMTVRPT